MRRLRLATWVTALVIAARFVFCLYRGATQSITIDEAHTYNTLLDGPWRLIFSQFDANHHVLHTIIARLSVRTLGLSEFTLRLPSLVSGLAMMMGVARLLDRITAHTALRFVALVGIAVHPLLLDFSIAARGYSMGLAALVWAIERALAGRYTASGALCGIAVSANLTMAFPVLGLIASLALPRWREALRMAVAAIAVATPILAGPLRCVSRDQFYFGARTLDESLRTIVLTTLLHNPEKITDATFRIANAWPYLLGALLLAAAWAAYRSKQRLVPLTFLITSAGLVIAHEWLGVLYPYDRTGLHWVLLGALALAAFAAELPGRVTPWVAALVAAAYSAQAVTQLEVDRFGIWEFDHKSRAIAEAVRDRGPGVDGRATIAADWLHLSSMAFYRRQMNLNWLAPVERLPETGPADFDFVIRDDKSNGARLEFRQR